MRKQRLEAWLCGANDQEPTPTEIAILLGTEPETVAAPLARSIRFVLAVLRDVYPDEATVWRWLCRPRREFGGACAADLLRTGRAAEVEALVVQEWNATRPLPRPRRTPGHLAAMR
jgi:hypothetical protein